VQSFGIRSQRGCAQAARPENLSANRKPLKGVDTVELFKKASPSDPAGLTLSNKAGLFGATVSELLQQEVEKRLPRHQRKIRPRAFVDRPSLCDRGWKHPKDPVMGAGVCLLGRM
jgi:hypothetical protein